MNKEQFFDEYYLIKQQVDDLLDKSRALEKEYLKANSPIPASVENPVLVEVDIEQTHIDRIEKVKDIRRIHDEKYLVGYMLNKPFHMTETIGRKEKYIDRDEIFRNHRPYQHPINHLLPGIRDRILVVTAQQMKVRMAMHGIAR